MARQLQASAKITIDDFSLQEGITIWWLTNAGFMINCQGKILFIDPAISLKNDDDPTVIADGEPLLLELPLQAKDVPELHAVLYTHADEDHLCVKTARLLKETGTIYFGPPPVKERLTSTGIPESQIKVAHYGERMHIDEISIVPTPAQHVFPWQGGYRWKKGDCCGFILHTPFGTIWHPGDTQLMDEHLKIKGIDLLLVDVSDDPSHLTVRGAARLANACEARNIVPHHYGTYDCPKLLWCNGNSQRLVPLIADAQRRYHIVKPGIPFTIREGEFKLLRTELQSGDKE